MSRTSRRLREKKWEDEAKRDELYKRTELPGITEPEGSSPDATPAYAKVEGPPNAAKDAKKIITEQKLDELLTDSATGKDTARKKPHTPSPPANTEKRDLKNIFTPSRPLKPKESKHETNTRTTKPSEIDTAWTPLDYELFGSPPVTPQPQVKKSRSNMTKPPQVEAKKSRSDPQPEVNKPRSNPQPEVKKSRSNSQPEFNKSRSNAMELLAKKEKPLAKAKAQKRSLGDSLPPPGPESFSASDKQPSKVTRPPTHDYSTLKASLKSKASSTEESNDLFVKDSPPKPAKKKNRRDEDTQSVYGRR